jgi:hypothetical protein
VTPTETRNSRGYLRASTWVRGLVKSIFRPRPRVRWWKWLDANVVIPDSSGGPNAGRLRTGRFPIFRGLYDLAQQRHVHFFTLCSSARAGKTLFCICLVLYWITERIGWIVWLDPTRNSARKLVRDELDDFLLQCKPVRALALITKKTWTTFEKHFRGKRMRVVGSGAEADLHGFNAELSITNELDACRASTEADAASTDKIEARTKLFAPSRLIVRNSTPQKGEFGPTWRKFLNGTQSHCYVPCPHCSDARAQVNRHLVFVPPPDDECRPGWSPLSYDPRLAGWQRFTFFSEKVQVPFDENLNPLVDESGALQPRSAWREEVTGQASFERFAIIEKRPRLDDPSQLEEVRVGWKKRLVRKHATYKCGVCQKEIEQADQSWMLARYRWMAHNPEAEEPDETEDGEEQPEKAESSDQAEHISAHVWSWYSPFELWGVICCEFLEAKGDLAKLIKFWVYTMGRPFVRNGAGVKEDDLDRVIARCPVRYVQGQIPLEAEILTITVDRQGTEMWYLIRAWGILWDHPDRPTWSALVDWGEAADWNTILEVCGHKELPGGGLRRFVFQTPGGERREYAVTAGLVDCGFEQQAVWDFCLTQSHWLSPSKGGDTTKTHGDLIRVNKVMDEALDLVWYWSDFFAANLFFDCIKDGSSHGVPINWWLPTNIDANYRRHLTDEYLGEKDGKRTWMTKTKTNHLADDEKLQRVLSGKIEERLDEIRDTRAAEEKADS